MTARPKHSDPFEALTWDDLEDWAGSRVVARGKSYQRSKRVKDLARIPEKGLFAWVHGSERYATQVLFEGGQFLSACSCPYPGTCKHAVAVVLEYLDLLKKGTSIPPVTETDPRMDLLGEFYEEDGDKDDEGDREDSPLFSTSERVLHGSLRPFLEEQTKDQLIAWIEGLAVRYPNVRESLTDRKDLSKGDINRMVAALRREIRNLGSEHAWRNSWSGEGSIPDYSRVRERMEALLSKGYADEVVALGKELLEVGTRQVEESHDEGETGAEISSCLDVVFQALPRSSLSPADQMLWAVDACIQDYYDLCTGAASFWNLEHPASDWGIVADTLLDRLRNHPVPKGENRSTECYPRDILTNWILRALEHSGRYEEIIPLCKEEAPKTMSYIRLVRHLVEADRIQEAEEWIEKGIRATRKESPGIASQLLIHWREIREKEGDWLRVAGFQAEIFFKTPTFSAFQDLEKAAGRAGVWSEVGRAALEYLETGKLPWRDPQWPLPRIHLMESREGRQRTFPVIDTLIEIAISEKQPEEVLRWYDHPRPKGFSGGWMALDVDRVATAIMERYPDRALEIWKGLAEREIARAQPKAYEDAARYLKKVQRLLKDIHREKEWQGYLDHLRQVHLRKKRLLEVLDQLSGRRIVER